MTLLDQLNQENIKKNAPLAERMRARTLDEFYGQEHLLGPGRLLRRAVKKRRLLHFLTPVSHRLQKNMPARSYVSYPHMQKMPEELSPDMTAAAFRGILMKILERVTRFELATSTLARWRSAK